ncbi:hypothetical protein [Asticcacaulis endophyticus]|uniref:Uncharacterized protein n=1 Tax=Asticcacaulis endophyticus TaxID=1395890 RepID=A0A918PVF8_9CAUL|nr:hypothetical protein [Asticcacaulis endophyticus]GGZ21974.1 hypothetical protein GCM10011273_03470 [Asticcacaulis endophyticus]
MNRADIDAITCRISTIEVSPASFWCVVEALGVSGVLKTFACAAVVAVGIVAALGGF